MEGSTFSCAIPYSRRLAISMLISAEFATAHMVMMPKTLSGNQGAPASTTLSRGVAPSPKAFASTRAMAVIDTSR